MCKANNESFYFKKIIKIKGKTYVFVVSNIIIIYLILNLVKISQIKTKSFYINYNQSFDHFLNKVNSYEQKPQF